MWNRNERKKWRMIEIEIYSIIPLKDAKCDIIKKVKLVYLLMI